MKDRRIHLRIKIKSLAAEARIIRQEAKKLSGLDKHTLNEHRTGIVREQARLSQLAYGALRGVPYRVMEQRCGEDNFPDLKRILAMARKFGASDEEKLATWHEEAAKHLRQNK